MNIVPIQSVHSENEWTGFWVVAGPCAHCKLPINYEMAFAVSYPHAALLHERCMNFYDFDQHWPHAVPLQALRRRSTGGIQQ